MINRMGYRCEILYCGMYLRHARRYIPPIGLFVMTTIGSNSTPNLTQTTPDQNQNQNQNLNQNQNQNQNQVPLQQHPPSTGEQNSLMQQVSTQERRISELSQALDTRNAQLLKFESEKKVEMEALMAGMKQWISNLDVKSDTHKEEFEKGLQRLVDTSSFDNGVWQVMTCASASAAKMEEQYQSLKTQYDELQTRSNGGVFMNPEHRVGDKRSAESAPNTESTGAPDFFSNFIADVSRTGYQVM
jgi:hypothetical protein